MFGTGPETAYDQITELVAEIMRVPICLISVVGKDVQWMKSRYDVTPPADPAPLVLTAPAVRVRRGKDVKLVFVSDTGFARQPDQKLVMLIDEAMAARAAITADPQRTMRDAAASIKQCRHRLTKLVRLSFLAPELVDAIVAGKHPAALTPAKLLDADLPLGWIAQKAMLGFC